MKKQILAVTLIVLTFNCFAQKTKSKIIDFEEFATKQFKKNVIQKDPLILINSKPVGLLSEINLDELKIKKVDETYLTVVPKNSEYLKKIWGENAANGIINITKLITLHCGTPPKRIYLVDDIEIDTDAFLKLLKTDTLETCIQIDDVIDKENKDLVLMIMTTKKKKK